MSSKKRIADASDGTNVDYTGITGIIPARCLGHARSLGVHARLWTIKNNALTSLAP